MDKGPPHHHAIYHDVIIVPKVFLCSVDLAPRKSGPCGDNKPGKSRVCASRLFFRPTQNNPRSRNARPRGADMSVSRRSGGPMFIVGKPAHRCSSTGNGLLLDCVWSGVTVILPITDRRCNMRIHRHCNGYVHHNQTMDAVPHSSPRVDKK